MEDKVKQSEELLKRYNQEHIIQLLEKTKGIKREKIIDNILSIDFDELKSLYEKAKKPLDIDISALEPVTALSMERLPEEKVKAYYEAGREIVCNNKFAVATMAGGQGTRLRNHKS